MDTRSDWFEFLPNGIPLASDHDEAKAVIEFSDALRYSSMDVTRSFASRRQFHLCTTNR